MMSMYAYPELKLCMNDCCTLHKISGSDKCVYLLEFMRCSLLQAKADKDQNKKMMKLQLKTSSIYLVNYSVPTCILVALLFVETLLIVFLHVITFT